MLVAVSDLHLGSGKNLGPDRHKDILDSLKQAVDYAIKKRVKYFLVLGDTFDYPNPSNMLREEFFRLMRLLSGQDIEIKILTGNHEFANKSHAMSGAARIDSYHIKIKDEPQLMDDGMFQWIFLPHSRDIDSKTKTWEEIIKSVTKISKTNRLKIVVGHFPVTGSKVGPSDYELPTSVTKKMLKKMGADLILLGDIHKPQKLFENCYYAGSIDRINFGERKEKKRFLYIKFKKKEPIVKSIPIKTRKLLQFTVGSTKYKKANDAIVKPIINCNETDINKFDTATITHKLEKAGAHFIMPFEWNIEPKNKKKKRSTVSEINKKKYIKKYIKRNHPKANVDKLVRKYREIIKT